MTIPQSEWTHTVTINAVDHPIAFYMERNSAGVYEWRMQANRALEHDRHALKGLILSLNQWCATYLYVMHPKAEPVTDPLGAQLLDVIEDAQRDVQQALAQYLLLIAGIPPEQDTTPTV